MKKQLTILGINGSPHKNGVCVKLLGQTLSFARKEGATTRLIHLVDVEKDFYHSHYKRNVEADFQHLARQLLECDGFIIATPVYWMNVSSLVKNFLEKLTVFEINNFKLEGKVAGFIATCEEDGAWKAILDMAGPLDHMGVLFPPYAMVWHNRKFTKRSEKNWMRKDVALLGQNVVELCRMIQTYKPKWGYRR